MSERNRDGRDASPFVTALRARSRGRKRMPIKEVWQAFNQVTGGWLGDPDARNALAETLRRAVDAGALALPSATGTAWDRTVDPELPRWVTLPPQTVATPASDHRREAWPPELVFVLDERRPRLLDELRAIRRFLAEGGRERPIVPQRERSLELFGDEKRLDALRSTAYFRQGRLSLELLRCRHVDPPLAIERGPAHARGRPVLVIENLHTWESFRLWNAERGMYAAIVFGSGRMVASAYARLPELLEQCHSSELRYFGDLDGPGLDIPVAADARLFSAFRLRLRAADEWYTKLWERRAEARPVDKLQGRGHRTSTNWLPASLRADVEAMLDEGLWLPQEWVGTDALAAM